MSIMSHPLVAKIMRLQGTAGRLTSYLPEPIHHKAASLLGYRHDYPELNSHLKLLLAFRNLRNANLIGDDPVQSRLHFRAEMASIIATPTPVGSVRDFEIAGAAGMMRVRHYTPANASGALPLLVFYHGGGFVVGDLDTHDEPCRLLCKYGQMQVLSVDYRLAPEHKAPAAPQDCLAALRWAYANAEALGVDPQRIAVGGDSAGGNLSAVVSQQSKGQAYAPKAQLLIYPVVDLVAKYESHRTYTNGLFLSQDDMDNAKARYAFDSGLMLGDPLLSPLHGDLDGLCPALVVTAGLDVLRDEGELYAHRLQEHGNYAIFYRVANQGHGFINITSINSQAKDATIRMAQDFRQLLDQIATSSI
jgi:acetyl esterase